MQVPSSNQNSLSYTGVSFEIRQEHMYKLMKEEAITFICNIFSNLEEEEINKHQAVAKSIKDHMDRLYGPPWHCIMGKSFGSSVTYKNNHFLYMYIGNKAIMIYKQ